MPDARDTKLVMFHCPEDVREEMDALCEHNMIDRTVFLLQAIYKMMDYLESQRDALSKETFSAYPELEESVLLAAETEEENR